MRLPQENKREFDTSYTQNRELSWLKFNMRVLDEALDETVPLYERMKFVEIFTSNLDEFFMVRVGSLCDINRMQPDLRENKSLMTAREQLESIYSACQGLYRRREKVFHWLQDLLEEKGIVHCSMESLDEDRRKYLERYFMEQILPVLSPQIIDMHHPFPQLRSKGLYVAALLKYKRKVTLGMIPLPPSLQRYALLPGNGIEYVLLEEVISWFAYKIYPSYPIIDKAVFSITRNADINPDDEEVELGEGYLEQMRKAIRKRRSMSPVRLEIQCDGDSLVAPYLRRRLGLEQKQVYVTTAPLTLEYFYGLEDNFTREEKERLCYRPWHPIGLSGRFGENVSMMAEIRKRDVLLSYPYDDFGIFLALVKEAVHDPEVISIKITVYRIGKGHVKLMSYMILAAEMGKDVTVLLELKARFDEENNMGWVDSLKEAGCHILYGFDGYKVHAKVCLITNRHEGEIDYITYVGTGNFNAKTAALYTDAALLTSDGRIGKDAVLFFRNMGISNLNGSYGQLLVAPVNFKSRMLELIRREQEKAGRGEEARMILKMNSLTDRQLIDALVKAGRAGVRVDMIIRGICCLVPEIPGSTENIHVRCIVGRFLEHARIFVFGADEEAEMFISSADWMTRNTENRVEVACPIHDKSLRRKLWDMLEIQLRDNVKARKLDRDGLYHHPEKGGVPLCAQEYFMEHAAVVDGSEGLADCIPSIS